MRVSLRRAVAADGSDHAIIVLGHREPGISEEHRISAESLGRVAVGAQVARAGARAIIFTGYTSTDGLAEAEQMALAWPVDEVPVLTEIGARTTAGNAANSLPLILALGGVARVTVVSSAWHLRTRYYFAPYRAHGLRVSFRWSWQRGNWPRMLLKELWLMQKMRAERRAAYEHLAQDEKP